MSYTSAEAVLKRIKGFSVSDDLMAESILAADNLINMQIDENMEGAATNPLLVQAGTYYAAMDIIDAMYDTTENRSPTAIQYEKLADRLVAKFIEENEAVATVRKRRASSRTPSDSDMELSRCGYVR